MKKIVFSLIFIFIVTTLFAQKEGNIWYFGDQAGIDFNSGTPVSISNGALFTYDNSSTICDSAGNVLFYTDGVTVWNSAHQIMVNGTGLNGNQSGGQSALIVHRPGSYEYYVFSVRDFGIGPLWYSVVDLSQQGGLGAVTNKNISLYSNTTEKLAAYYNCSLGCYWLISHKYGTAEFYNYKIDSTGINTTPVISNVGLVHNAGPTNDVNNSAGQLSISRDGSTLAGALFYSDQLELFDFNISLGTVSNARLISNLSNAWGVEFSGNGLKLYLTKWFTSDVTQFDLSSGNINTIANSATIVGNATGSGGYHAGYLQRGPDDKVYVARWNVNYIAVIDSPDNAGMSCNFINNGVNLGNGLCKAGLSRSVMTECQTTGIIQSQNDVRIKIYQDHQNGLIYFSIPQHYKNETILLEIVDGIGRMVRNEKFQNEIQFSIDVNALKAGIYTLRMRGRNFNESRKIVIEN